MLSALLVSTLVVTLAEIGDKTQLLALMLSCRLRRPVPIILGIAVATLLNHALAGALGAWLSTLMSPATARWVLGLGFLGFALWALIPDRLDEDEEAKCAGSAWGTFMTTTMIFFVVEIGDKTQVATVALAAQYAQIVAVVVGTTLGMLLANVPVVLLGESIARRIPLNWIRAAAAALFAVLGLLTLSGIGTGSGGG